MSKRFIKCLATALLLLILILVAQVAALLYFASPVPIQTPVDLIAVFPGDVKRLTAGVDLVAKGVSSNLLVGGSTSVAGRVKALAAHYPEFPDDFRLIDPGPCRDTFQDALGTARKIKENGFKSVVLVTSDYHMLRSWVLLKLAGTGVEVQRHVVPALKSASTKRQARLLALEMVKFWGNLVQVAQYRISETSSSTRFF